MRSDEIEPGTPNPRARASAARRAQDAQWVRRATTWIILGSVLGAAAVMGAAALDGAGSAASDNRAGDETRAQGRGNDGWLLDMGAEHDGDENEDVEHGRESDDDGWFDEVSARGWGGSGGADGGHSGAS